MGEPGFPELPLKPFATHGGAKVPHRKNTAETASAIMPPPQQVVISMQQHIGAPCEPIVKAGDEVKVGQLIADSDKFVSAPIHASVSGTVSKIDTILLPSGNKVKAVVIDSDGLMTPHESVVPQNISNAKELIDAARRSGLVGLGGAGFPAHVKLNVPKDKKIDVLIINGAECEPYLTADYRAMIENSQDILDGVYKIKELLKVKNVLICIEENKPEAIKLLTEIAANEKKDPNNEVRVVTLKARYPQGAEKILIQAATGRRVGAGQLPADVGCIIMNITSVAFLARYIKTGMPLVSKRLTIDGSAVASPQNVIVPIGTKIKDVMELCGGYASTPRKIIMGGPMMGIAIYDDSLPILKQNNGILAFAEGDALLREPSACIRCGRCVKGCPMNLMPTLLEQNARTKNLDALEKLSINTCMECGTCSYVCPAGRKLVQTIRLGKQALRERK